MDQWSKTTTHLKRDSDCVQHAKLRSDCCTRFVKFIFWIVIDLKDIFDTGESFLSSSSSPTESAIQIRERKDGNSSDISPVQVSNSVDDRSRQSEKTTIEWGNSSSEIPEWLQEFRKIRLMMKFHYREASHASSSHEVSLEPTTKRREDFG